MGSSVVIAKKKILWWVGFFVIAFFSGSARCHPKFDLSEEEKTALEPLFRFLLFDNHGVFVLFGSKPMCDAMIPPRLDRKEAQKLLEQMPHHLRHKIRRLEEQVDFERAWETWQGVQQRFPIQNYILTKRSDSIYLVNVKNVVKVMNRNYQFFEEILGKRFSPKEVIYELWNQQSVSWEKLFRNHRAMGLLYGFGEENAEIFEKILSLEMDPYFSTDKRVDVFEAAPNNFSIPIFVSHPNDPIVRLYEQEKQEISRHYKDKRIMEVSLQALRK